MAKKSTKKATKKAVKKATKKLVKKTAKKATKKATKKAAKKATKKATKKVAKATAKKATKKATKKVAKATAKKATTKKAAAVKATTKKATAKVAAQPAKKAAAPKAAAPKAAKPAALPVPAVGATAPGFTLLNEQGVPTSLDDFRGKKVVVYFYPRAMTPGCTVQACGLRDVKADLEGHNIVVLGISPDKPAELQKFIDKEHLNFTLLSDADNSVARAYGAYGQKSFMGKTFDGVLRQSYLVDEQGKLVHVINKVDTQTHAQDVIDLFSKLA